MNKELINLSNLQRFLSKLNEKFALKKVMKGISEDAEGNIIIGEEGLVPTPNENSKGKFLRSDGEWALPSETAVYDSMTIEEGVAGVSEVDKVLNAKNLKQIVNSDGFLTSLDSSKLTGVINIENLPQGALERILIVSSKEERLTLLDTEVQLGDVVKESDTGLMYYVINTEKLNSEEGYTQFTAGMASSVPWSGVTNKPSIPTKTSDLTNDSNFAIDSNVVHRSGDETISGVKMFKNCIYRQADISTSTVETVYILEDTNAKPCGSIYNKMHWYNNNVYNRHQSYNATSDKNMYLEILSDNDGSGVINTGGSVTNNKNLTTVTNDTGNSYVATMGWVNNPATSTNVVHRSGNEYIGGAKTFTQGINIQKSDIDLTITPTSNKYSTYLFTDKNNKSLCVVQYAQRATDVNDLDLYVFDKNSTAHGIQITTNNELLPIGNNYKLGSSGAKWANVYATTFNGNLKGNADSATKASYLDNYSLPNSNKIYLDWDNQVKSYVGLKVDNTDMGGLITTKNIGSQSVKSATYSTTPATTDNSTRIATTAWVRNYVNSVAGSNTVGSSVSAYWSNSSNVTATGQSSSGGYYPECYSEYVSKTPVVGTIYSGAQLYTVLNTYASATGSKNNTTGIYYTNNKAQATLSNPLSSTAKYLCTTANTFSFRAYTASGNTSSVGASSVVNATLTKSIFIRVQ